MIDLMFTRLWPSLRLDNKTSVTVNGNKTAVIAGAGVYVCLIMRCMFMIIIIIIFDNVYVYDVYLCRCGWHATSVSLMLILPRCLETVRAFPTKTHTISLTVTTH